MPGRHGKPTVRKGQVRLTSPEIPSPVKPVEPTILDDIENQMPVDDIESKPPPPSEHDETKADLPPMSLLFANGQPLLTNFEEKYLVDLILKHPSKDIEVLLQEKLPTILQLNYGSQSAALFTLHVQWIFDFLLKHFHALVEHGNARDVCDKFLAKAFDRNNATVTSKHWQLQTLVNEHAKKQAAHPAKRRMTVRHIDLH